MIQAWEYAAVRSHENPSLDDVIVLGQLVEPVKNARGFREVGVGVGWHVKPDWRVVPRQMGVAAGGSERVGAR
jgi:hypothetical protein